MPTDSARSEGRAATIERIARKLFDEYINGVCIRELITEAYDAGLAGDSAEQEPAHYAKWCKEDTKKALDEMAEEGMVSPEPDGVKSVADYDMQLVEGLIKRLASAERERDELREDLAEAERSERASSYKVAELERENQALREALRGLLSRLKALYTLHYGPNSAVGGIFDEMAALAQPSAPAKEQTCDANTRHAQKDTLSGTLGQNAKPELTSKSAAPTVASGRSGRESLVEKAADLITNLAQIIDVVKGEWGESWSAWDQEQRDGITSWLMAYYAQPPAAKDAESKEKA